MILRRGSSSGSCRGGPPLAAPSPATRRTSLASAASNLSPAPSRAAHLAARKPKSGLQRFGSWLWRRVTRPPWHCGSLCAAGLGRDADGESFELEPITYACHERGVLTGVSPIAKKLSVWSPSGSSHHRVWSAKMHAALSTTQIGTPLAPILPLDPIVLTTPSSSPKGQSRNVPSPPPPPPLSEPAPPPLPPPPSQPHPDGQEAEGPCASPPLEVGGDIPSAPASTAPQDMDGEPPECPFPSCQEGSGAGNSRQSSEESNRAMWRSSDDSGIASSLGTPEDGGASPDPQGARETPGDPSCVRNVTSAGDDQTSSADSPATESVESDRSQPPAVSPKARTLHLPLKPLKSALRVRKTITSPLMAAFSAAAGAAAGQPRGSPAPSHSAVSPAAMALACTTASGRANPAVSPLPQRRSSRAVRFGVPGCASEVSAVWWVPFWDRRCDPRDTAERLRLGRVAPDEHAQLAYEVAQLKAAANASGYAAQWRVVPLPAREDGSPATPAPVDDDEESCSPPWKKRTLIVDPDEVPLTQVWAEHNTAVPNLTTRL